MRYQFNETMPEDYAALEERSGHPVSDRLTVIKVLRNSLFMVGIYEPAAGSAPGAAGTAIAGGSPGTGSAAGSAPGAAGPAIAGGSPGTGSAAGSAPGAAGSPAAEELVAFGRVTGDDAKCYLVTDVMVDRRYEGLGYEALILKEIEDYLRITMSRGSSAYVFVDRPYDEICRKFGFRYLDGDYQAAMVRMQR